MSVARLELMTVIPAWSASKRQAHAERVSPMRAAENAPSVKAEEHLPGSAMSGHSNQPSRSFWPPTPEGTVQPGNAYASGVAQANANVVSSSQVQRGRRPSLPEYDQLPVRRQCFEPIRAQLTADPRVPPSPRIPLHTVAASPASPRILSGAHGRAGVSRTASAPARRSRSVAAVAG
jgi:hypothetical protein